MRYIRKKLDYDTVKQIFEKEGYTLLSTTYRNTHGSLMVKCPKGHEWKTNLNNFHYNGRRCAYCSRRAKYTLDQVKAIFAEYGYTVLDKVYISVETPIRCICPENHTIQIRLSNFLNGKRCIICANINMKKLKSRKDLNEKASQLVSEINKIDGMTTRVGFVQNHGSEEIPKVNDDFLEKIEEMKRNIRKTKIEYRD